MIRIVWVQKRGCIEKNSDFYLPNRISAEANSSRASLKLSSSKGGGKYDADDAPLPIQNRENLLFWLEKMMKGQDRTISHRDGILTKFLLV